MTVTDQFQLLKSELHGFADLGREPGSIGFLGREALGFLSIAGTLKERGMVGNACVDERYISNCFASSLIEGFFWLVYILDERSSRPSRHGNLVTLFKRDYCKFNYENSVVNCSLAPPGQGWSQIQGCLDVRSMITQVRIDQGNRLEPLYAIYRIASFDTHRKSLISIIVAALGDSNPSFKELDIDFAFNLIANQYLFMLRHLDAASEIYLLAQATASSASQLVLSLELRR
ncbi:hypothetical protein [Synechococcus sp. CCAP 1479/9]|uniref:hypothetical protein n=1 Tax=Synechococcus sp. CCAP 1479/9 TaxID=1221593 RepID=UPI001C2314FE|nr:hypothetical protein [Synechococcus sp. CCAP 1479/9]